MINKLKRKFILITMVSVFSVLFVIMCSINAINYARITSNADDILSVLYENGGEFFMPNDQGQAPGEMQENPPSDFRPKRIDDKRIDEETPYETRYFSVSFNGDQAETNVKNIAAVSSEQAVDMANNALTKTSKKGYIGKYRYLVSEDGSFVLFLDCKRQINTANEFLVASAILSAVGLVAVFVLSLFLSKFAIKPMQESYEKQKRFVTDASHELKTPLTIISANNELTEMTSGQTQETQTIAKQVTRMTEMVKNLTMLSKLDEMSKAQKTVFDLSDVLNDMSETFRINFESNGRVFQTEIREGMKVNADETLVCQALSILFDNASKYAKTKVDLVAKPVGKNVTVELSNDAEGIEQGDLDVCFERFYRSPTAAGSSVSGSGIGLSIAKEITNLCSGKIHAFGQDDIFKITLVLPLAK